MSAPRALCGLFALLAATHLGALLADATTVVHLTKPALMPVLAAYAALRGGPRPLVAALLCGCGGDVLLQLGGETAFLAGMGCFAVGHLCYLTLFARSGRRRTVPWVAYGYGAVWLGSTAALWPGLDAGLRVPVAAYSLLLTAMALGALGVTRRSAGQGLGTGPWAGLGGALFLLSDGLIAAGLADWPQLPVPQFWIMATYIAAQYLLTVGLLHTTARETPLRPLPAAA